MFCLFIDLSITCLKISILSEFQKIMCLLIFMHAFSKFPRNKICWDDLWNHMNRTLHSVQHNEVRSYSLHANWAQLPRMKCLARINLLTSLIDNNQLLLWHMQFSVTQFYFYIRSEIILSTKNIQFSSTKYSWQPHLSVFSSYSVLGVSNIKHSFIQKQDVSPMFRTRVTV